MAHDAEVHEVLVKARNLIARVGWWKPGLPGGGHCVVTAMGEVRDAATSAFDCQVAFAEGAGIDAEPHHWNDAPGRTKAEVLAAFDRAISLTAPSPDFDSLETSVLEPVA